MQNLSQIHLGSKKLQIVGFSGAHEIIQRLKEMGLHPGLEISYQGRAPFGGPFLFRFANTVVAMRPDEAACTLIKETEKIKDIA